MSQRATASTRSAWSTQARYRGEQAKEVGLRLVGPVRQRARKAPFVVVLIGLVGSGLVGLIFLSTLLQGQAFAISDLKREAALLEAQRAELAVTVNDLQSPAAIAERALDEGMVPNTNPVFLRLADGKVIGKPVPAEAGTNVRRVD
jgi:cell division protein FtsB